MQAAIMEKFFAIVLRSMIIKMSYNKKKIYMDFRSDQQIKVCRNEKPRGLTFSIS